MKINYQGDLLRTLNTKDNDETLLGVGWSLCRCNTGCPLKDVCPKLSVDPFRPESKKAVVKIICKGLWACKGKMLKILQQLTFFEKASYKDLAWTEVEGQLYIFSTPTRLVPYVTWCLTWFTTRSLVLLLLPKAMLEDLHNNLPNPRGEPISKLGYASSNGMGLDFSNDPKDMQYRANLPSVVHALEFFDEEEWEKNWDPGSEIIDIEDIGVAAKEKAKDKAKRNTGFIRMPKDTAEMLSPTIVLVRGRGGRGRAGRTP